MVLISCSLYLQHSKRIFNKHYASLIVVCWVLFTYLQHSNVSLTNITPAWLSCVEFLRRKLRKLRKLRNFRELHLIVSATTDITDFVCRINTVVFQTYLVNYSHVLHRARLPIMVLISCSLYLQHSKRIFNKHYASLIIVCWVFT